MKNILNHPAVENFGKKVNGLAQSGVSYSKQMAEVAKLRVSTMTEEENLKKAYLELGKLYFAEHGQAPDPTYVALCSRISKCNDVIQANRAQIAELKKTVTVTEADFADDVQMQTPQEEAQPQDDREEAPAEAVLTADGEAGQAEPIPDEE